MSHSIFSRVSVVALFGSLAVAPLSLHAQEEEIRYMEPTVPPASASSEEETSVGQNPVGREVDIDSEALYDEQTAIEADGEAQRTMILGMRVGEGDEHRAKVVQVAVTSPAWDAGIREGDEIVSFGGFKGTSYSDWVRGVRRIAGEATQGGAIPIEISRDGEQMNLRVRVPEANAPRIAQMQRDQQQLNQQGVIGQFGEDELDPRQRGRFPTYANTNVFFGDGGFFGGSNGGGDNGTGDTFGMAIAQLQRVNTARGGMNNADVRGGAASRRGAETNRRAQGLPAGNNAGGPAGGMVGMAGFRDSQQGLLAMVDVAGLEPGVYLVGIGQPGANTGNMGQGAFPGRQGARGSSGQFGDGGRGSRPAPRPGLEGAVPPGNDDTILIQPHGPSQENFRPMPGGNGAAGQGGQSGGTSGGIPSVGTPQQQGMQQPLRQQLDNSAVGGAPSNSGAQQGAAARNQQQGGAIGANNTGQVRPPSASATGQVDPQQAAQNRPGMPGANQPLEQNDLPLGGGSQLPGMPQMARIGILRVNQTGTGQLQEVVQGVRVADIVGQSVLVYARSGGDGIDPANGGQFGAGQFGPGQFGAGQAGAGQPGQFGAGQTNQLPMGQGPGGQVGIGAGNMGIGAGPGAAGGVQPGVAQQQGGGLTQGQGPGGQVGIGAGQMGQGAMNEAQVQAQGQAGGLPQGQGPGGQVGIGVGQMGVPQMPGRDPASGVGSGMGGVGGGPGIGGGQGGLGGPMLVAVGVIQPMSGELRNQFNNQGRSAVDAAEQRTNQQVQPFQEELEQYRQDPQQRAGQSPTGTSLPRPAQ